MSNEGKVYIVLVSGKLKKGQAAAFQQCFAPLAEHVTREETGTLSYQLSWGEDDPDRLIIFERYTSKEYLEQVHWQSAPFKKFREDLAAAGVEWESKEVIKYWESGPGYMVRP